MVWSSKLLVIFIVLVIFSNVPNCYSSYILQASNQQRDTALANYYYSKADSLNKVSLYIDANTYFNKSSILYQKSLTTKNINIFRKYIACNIKINENLRDQRKFDEAIAVLNQLLDEDIGSYDNSWKTYGKVYYEIARNLSFKGEYLAALEAYDKALQKFNIVLHGEDNLVIARIYNGKGETHEDNGDPYVAIKYYKKALGIFTTMYGSDDTRLGGVYTNLGLASRKTGDFATALDYFTQDLNIILRESPNDYFSLAISYNNIGLVYGDLKEFQQAITYYTQAIDNVIKVYGEDNYVLYALYNNLGNLYKKTEKYAQSFESFHESIRISSLAFGKDHPKVAQGYINLGAAYVEGNELEQAEASLLKGLEIDLAYYGKYHSEIAIAYSNIATLRTQQNKNQEALVKIQKGLHALIYEFDNPNIYCNPSINSASGSKLLLLKLLVVKADILSIAYKK